MDKANELLIREKLVSQRAEIIDELERHAGRQSHGSASELADQEDRAAALGDLWVEDRIVADDGNLLAKIDFAIQRLDDGKHDVCADCGGLIPVARLLAKPSASLCISCQEKKSG